MSIGAYLSAKSEYDEYKRNLDIEYREIEHLREKEIEEIKDIYIDKGFEGELLEQVVAVIIADKDRWVDVMMKEELGMVRPSKGPFRIGLSTLVAFIIVGFIPLLTYVVSYITPLSSEILFPTAIGLTAI